MMPNATDIAITGVGLITPIGHSAWSTWRRLLDGVCLTDRCKALPDEIDPVMLIRAIGGISIARHTPCDPAVTLCEHVLREAIDQAHLTHDELEETPILIGSSKGAMMHMHDAAHAMLAGRVIRDSLAATIALGPFGYLESELRKRLSIGPARGIVGACASSLIAVHVARQLITSGRATRVIVLTVESAMTELFIHSYRRLGVLPPLEPAGYRGLPLDDHRCGFVLGEVASAVVLTAEQDPTFIRSHPLAWLGETAVAAEANDLIRTPAGRPALRRIADQLLADGVDLIHPHATGTQENDAEEIAVYADVLSGQIAPSGHQPTRHQQAQQQQQQRRHLTPQANPTQHQSALNQIDLYAAKGAIGHGLGSAGLCSLVLAALASRTQQRPPMPWLTHPVRSDFHLQAERSDQLRPIERQAIFAAGFGSHVAGAIVRCGRGV